MGWWSQNEEGHSFANRATDGPEMLWGDGVADIIDNALADISAEFQRDCNRKPTEGEITSGLLFSLRGAIDRGLVTKP
jgi:hypothetical protein